MKIKASLYGENITIIDFVPAYDRDIKVIYITLAGNVSSCYLDEDKLQILDEEYIPVQE